MMHRAAILLVAALTAAAQETPDLFTKAPPQVDEALRARMSEFFQDHVDGKYRQAEQLVAEDTKDFFYSSKKPRYLSFEIVRIQYSHEFTRAKATVLCEQYVMMPGFTDKPMKVPTPSTWKLEPDGKWYWYVDPEELRRTPFGIAKPGQNPEGGAPKIPDKSEMDFIFTQVKTDRSQVELKAGEPAKVTVTNGARGSVNVVIRQNTMGVEAKLDRSQLGPGESAVLTLKKGSAKKAGTIQLQVEPTNQIIPIQVTVE